MFWIIITMCTIMTHLAMSGKEPPSLPLILGLKNIDGCDNCIVGEFREKFNVSCMINHGSRPHHVSMTIGNEMYTLDQYNSTSTVYIKFFTLQEYHHMNTVTISVKNDALLTPLTASARVFVIKPPSVQRFLVPKTLKEGDDINITCAVDEGRPVPSVYFNISGSKVSPSHLHTRTSANETIASLTTFEREWNQENITCCRYNKWYKNQLECSLPEQVDYLFPPTNVTLKLKLDEETPNQMYAVCTVYDSNPVCQIQLSAPGEIIGLEKYSRKYSSPNVAWNTEYAVHLNVGEDDNVTDIACDVDCDKFSVNLSDSASIPKSYQSSVIQFNISGSILNVTKGKQVYVDCSVRRIPASNISWTEELGSRNLTMKQCYMESNCVLAIQTDLVARRRFMCANQKSKNVGHKYLTVNILEKFVEEEHPEELKVLDLISYKFLIWIILGSCLLITGIVTAIILSVVIWKKHQDQKKSQVRYNANVVNVRNLHNPIYDLQRMQVSAAQAREIDDETPEHVLAVKRKTRKNVDNTNSQVNIIQYHVEDGQLYYADLDLDPNETQSKRYAVKRPDSQTEYADIDYVVTKAEKEMPNVFEDDDETSENYQQTIKRTNEQTEHMYPEINEAESSSQSYCADDGQLIYADLEFDPNLIPSKGATVKRQDSLTEYADIDYVKTLAKKDILDQESIYAKQKRYKSVNKKASCKLM